MLSYGARPENIVQDRTLFYLIYGTPWFVRAFDTPLAVLAAEENNDYSGSCYHKLPL